MSRSVAWVTVSSATTDEVAETRKSTVIMARQAQIICRSDRFDVACLPTFIYGSCHSCRVLRRFDCAPATPTGTFSTGAPCFDT